MNENNHSHSYTVTEVTYPIGTTSDNKVILQVEKHSFCGCGDLQVQKDGTRVIG
jgi:hypothetical protein